MFPLGATPFPIRQDPIMLAHVLVLLLAVTQALESRFIWLTADRIDTTQRPGLHESDLFDVLADDAEPQLYLIQIDRAHRSHLQSMTKNWDYIPDDAYLMSATPDEILRLRNSAGIQWIGQLRPSQKLHPSLNQTTSTPISSLLVTMRGECNRAMGRLQSKLPHNRIRLVRHDRLRVDLQPGQSLDDALSALAHDPAVVFIERRWRPRLRNRWSRGVIQNGLTMSADYTTATGLTAWDERLYGQNQIIGIADSGIDINNCMFVDGPNIAIPYQPFRMNPTTSDVIPSRHRKIAQYISYADASDDTDGHGTHVAGIAAGSPLVSNTQIGPYQGMAPAAKIAFFDIGMSNGQLSIPDDLTSLLDWPYLAGARIHSNSWGTDSVMYDSLARDLDQYMYEHDDMLIVVAAGNSGDCASLGTVTSPATAKNIVTVGADMTNLESYQITKTFPPAFNQFPPSLFDETNIALFSSRGPTSDLRIKPDLVAPGFNTISAKVGGNNGCDQPFTSVLTAKSGTSMAAPALASSLLLIRQYFLEGFYPSGRRNASDSFSPSGSLIKAIAIAGGRLLTGSRMISDKFTQPPNQQKCPSIQFASIAQQPGIDQGWGRLQLNTVLEFRDNTTSSPFFLYILGGTNGQVSIASSETHTYQMCLVPSTVSHVDHKIVLTWTDPPGQPFSSIQLVNDLDLEVDYAGQTLLGNQGAYQGAGADRRNPVETVVLPNTNVSGKLQDVVIRIKAEAIQVGLRQNYSLVVTGLLRPYSCALIESGAVSLADKGEILPNRNVRQAATAMTASTTTSNLFQATTIAAAVIGAIVIILFIFALFHKMRSLFDW